MKAGERSDIEWALMAMSNLSTYEFGQVAVTKDATLIPGLIDMLKYFYGNSDFAYAASVLSNATCSEEGRKLMLDEKPEFYLQKLKEIVDTPD